MLYAGGGERKYWRGRHSILKRSRKMASLRDSWCYIVIWVLAVVAKQTADGYYSGYDYVAPFKAGPWKNAHATFYGDMNAGETMGGACGYGNLWDSGYGLHTAALSSVMFQNGKACGTCYELKCRKSKWCHPWYPSIKITATNLCPPNWYKPTNYGGWCNPPREHFDLSMPMYLRLAVYKSGIVPVAYRRIPCYKKGGVRFKFQGNPHWLLVYVMNVSGGGDVSHMWVKGSKMNNWISMSQNWGASFQAFAQLQGQALSFKLRSRSTGEIIIAHYVADQHWSTRSAYQARVNFR